MGTGFTGHAGSFQCAGDQGAGASYGCLCDKQNRGLAVWHNNAADWAAKVANLDRGDAFWTTWQAHVTEVFAAKELHRQAWQLQLQVALLSVKQDQTTTLDEVEVTAPRQTRSFTKVFEITAWQGNLPLDFATEYGAGMASRVATWWKARTGAGGTTVKWISFIHLYLDYQLTWAVQALCRAARDGWTAR